MQQILVKLSLIRSKVIDILVNISERGVSVDTLEERSAELNETSNLFVIRTIPWYRRCCRRCCPAWWFRSCGLERCFGDSPESGK